MYKKTEFELKVNDDGDVIYLKFPLKKNQKKVGVVQKQVRVKNYVDIGSSDIYLDYDDNNELVGIEILL